ncbi:ABC transporter permease, partial [Arthrobacter deserti]|nr:ABC transporter permease [Arthrobacter deserti]
PTLVCLGLLIAIAAATLGAYGMRHWSAAAWAVGRAAAQLAALSLVLSGVIGELPWVWAALGVMLTAAVLTTARRLRAGARMVPWIAASMTFGAGTVLAAVFLTGAIQPAPQNVLATGGIIIGSTMTVATLTGRRYRSSLVARRPEVEGWLALGAAPRQSTL